LGGLQALREEFRNGHQRTTRPSESEQYKKQAKDLIKARNAARPDAVQRVRASHPHSSKLARFTLADDAQLVIAREHGFQSWPKFAKHVAELTHDPAPIWKLAERAVIAGDVASLQGLLREHEQLFREGTAPEYGPGGLRPDYSGGDATAVLLREHQFETWPQFENYLADRARGTALAAKFEAAADAIVSGDTKPACWTEGGSRQQSVNPALLGINPANFRNGGRSWRTIWHFSESAVTWDLAQCLR
jgi:hypothetical protein